MGMTYYDEYRKPNKGFANLLVLWNALLAMVFYANWQGVAGVLNEPLAWALRLGGGMTPVGLWLLPMLSACGAWLALQIDQVRIARLLGVYPTLLLMLIVGWYYLTPAEWH